MERFDLMFYSDGTCYEAHGTTLEQDRRAETAAEGTGDDIVVHVTLTKENYADDLGLEALVAIHRFSRSAYDDKTPLELLLGKIFQAGVEYGRATANKKT